MLKRTIYCGELRGTDEARQVTLSGWVQRVRDIGHLVFVDLRDREGIVQLVFSSDRPELLDSAKKLRPEYVISVTGKVRKREPGLVNQSMATGEIEVAVDEIEILAASRVPPFQVTDPVQASEELRFKYRYIDLRRPSMQKNLRIRHEAALAVRNYLNGRGFIEVETPFLTRSTPEGARDYLVPSRVQKGKFYALPQSPQLFKQLLMVAGLDRYFQIVRCFRDEDLRTDRQPEFTQIDIEMSFITPEDIFALTEDLMVNVFRAIGVEIKAPFRRLTYSQSMERYGSDKPDLRGGMEIVDLSGLAEETGAEPVLKAVRAGGSFKGLAVKGQAGMSRSQIDKLNEKAKNLGLSGLFWIKKTSGLKSSLKTEARALTSIWEKTGAADDDLVLLSAGKSETVLKALGEIRKDFVVEGARGKRLYEFVWITDFPLFEWSEEEGKPVSVHHPFTSPDPADLDRLETDPMSVRALAYDIVLNGYELGGGSIRIQDPEIQKRVFKALRLSEHEAEEKFGFLLEALSYGAPPHGGIALGFDRLVMLLAGQESIREIIPFPKTTSALCLLTGSPSEVSDRQLAELGLKLVK